MKDVAVIQPEQPLIRIVYAKLLKAVYREVLEAEDVQDADDLSLANRLPGLQTELHHLQDILEKRLVKRFAKSLLICLAPRLAKWKQSEFFQKSTLLKQENLFESVDITCEVLSNSL